MINKWRSFGVLLGNEIKKYTSTKLTFLIFVVILIGLIIYAINIDSQQEKIITSDYKNYLQQEIDEINNVLNNPAYVMSDNMRQEYIDTVKINTYMIEHDIEPYKNKSAANYLITINNLFILVVVLCIILITQIITDEYRYSTTNILITVPCKRWKILLSKVITMIILCVGIVVLTYIVSFIVGGIFWGYDSLDMSIVTINNGKICVRNVVEQSLVNNFYNIFTLISCASLVMLISIVFRNGIVSICTGVSIYYFGSQIAISLSEYSWIKYSLFANMQFQFYFNGMEIFKGLTPKFSVAVLLIYSAIFIGLSFLVYNKRNVYD